MRGRCRVITLITRLHIYDGRSNFTRRRASLAMMPAGLMILFAIAASLDSFLVLAES